MPRIKNQTDKTPRKRRGVKTTHIRVSPEKKPYIVELVKKPLDVLKGLIKDQKENLCVICRKNEFLGRVSSCHFNNLCFSCNEEEDRRVKKIGESISYQNEQLNNITNPNNKGSK